MNFSKNIDSMSEEIYKYMNFDQISQYKEKADEGKKISLIEVT